jgi:hypothetical protein
MKTLITILAGIVTHSVVFTYLSDRTLCAARLADGGGERFGECVMRVLPRFPLTWHADTWSIVFLPGYLIAAVAGLLVGLILWAIWARR